MAVDQFGNVIVAGEDATPEAPEKGGEFTTIKYDSQGNQLWMAHYACPNTDGHQATAIALDRSGNVYVTGKAYCWTKNIWTYGTAKYDAAGSQQSLSSG